MSALAGAERIFAVIDEKPETDDGYVTLVNARRRSDGSLEETEEHTGLWIWRHPHGDGSLTYTQVAVRWNLKMWYLVMKKIKLCWTESP